MAKGESRLLSGRIKTKSGNTLDFGKYIPSE